MQHDIGGVFIKFERGHLWKQVTGNFVAGSVTNRSTSYPPKIFALVFKCAKSVDAKTNCDSTEFFVTSVLGQLI